MRESKNNILCKVSAVFPLQIFPDMIIVDKNKIDIIYRHFFWNKYVFTILHEDLTTVKISTGPFFASAYFEVRGYEINPKPVNYLKKSEAIKLREVIIGINKSIKSNQASKKISKKVNRYSKIGKVKEDISAAI